MRKLHIDGHEWTYRVGKGNVVIRDPKGISFVVACHKIKGVEDPDIYDRGQ